MREQTNERTNERTSKQANERTSKRTNERTNERTNRWPILPTNRSFVLFYPRPKAAAIDEVRQQKLDPDTPAYTIITVFFLTIAILSRGCARKN